MNRRVLPAGPSEDDPMSRVFAFDDLQVRVYAHEFQKFINFLITKISNSKDISISNGVITLPGTGKHFQAMMNIERNLPEGIPSADHDRKFVIREAEKYSMHEVKYKVEMEMYRRKEALKIFGEIDSIVFYVGEEKKEPFFIKLKQIMKTYSLFQHVLMNQQQPFIIRRRNVNMKYIVSFVENVAIKLPHVKEEVQSIMEDAQYFRVPTLFNNCQARLETIERNMKKAASKSPPKTEPAAKSPPETEPAAKSPPQTEPAAKSPPETEPAAKSPPQTEPAAKSPPQTEPAAKSPSKTEPVAKSPPKTEPTDNVLKRKLTEIDGEPEVKRQDIKEEVKEEPVV